jgi:hypothetical protein
MHQQKSFMHGKVRHRQITLTGKEMLFSNKAKKRPTLFVSTQHNPWKKFMTMSSNKSYPSTVIIERRVE